MRFLLVSDKQGSEEGVFLGASAASECAETEHPVLPWLPLSCRAAAALISPLSLLQEQGGFFSSSFFFLKHFCSHPGGLSCLTRWKMLPHHLNPLPRSWSPSGLFFFFVVRGNLLFFPSALSTNLRSLKSTFPHWPGFICSCPTRLQLLQVLCEL